MSKQKRKLVTDLQRHMTLYGYDLIELPIIEQADIFLVKAGDPIINTLFTFDRHNQQFALRPEFTAGVASRYARLYPGNDVVVRWQYNGPIFQQLPGKATSEYQQSSIGAELIGLTGPVADAEIISMAVHGLDAAGVPDSRLIIGHAGLTRHLLQSFHLEGRIERFLLHHSSDLHTHGKAYLLEQLERLHTFRSSPETRDLPEDARLTTASDGLPFGGRTGEDINRRLAQKRRNTLVWDQVKAALDFLEQWTQVASTPAEAFRQISAILPGDEAAWEMLLRWQTTLALLETSCEISPERVVVQPSLARSWEYYTGIVFEMVTANAAVTLGGGGRYDELIQLIGGHPPTPAVGFAYTLMDLLAVTDHESDADAPGIVALAVTADAAQSSAVMRWAHQLRLRDTPVRVITDAGTDALQVDKDGVCYTSQRAYTLAEIDQFIMNLREC
ncbi:MAG: ATP phosphoribosyltransferase regulatory subunit [Anaerolineae bacterium]|nr:ATP phosphoribosyltransferase regulatory subunit [Anaerolineae bacterium]